MFGVYELQVPSSIQSEARRASVVTRKSGTTVGAFIMGALSALDRHSLRRTCINCCADRLWLRQVIMLRSGTALFAMSLGMGAPLLLGWCGSGTSSCQKPGHWMVAVS